MTKRQRKEPSAYELPTPEKRAYGERLRLAREAAGLSQAEAAAKMGYAQAVQLSNMEAGNRMVTLRVLMLAARYYGTTMDYLCGLADDCDRDPAAAAVRHVSGRVTSEVQRLIEVMVHNSVETVRKVLPSASEGRRLAALTLELEAAIATFRARNKRFDDMPAGSSLIQRAEVAASAARQYVETMNRADRALRVRTSPHAGETAQVRLIPVLDETD